MGHTEGHHVSLGEAQRTLSTQPAGEADGIAFFSTLGHAGGDGAVCRVDFMAVFLCRRGQAEVRSGGEVFRVGAGDLWVSVGPHAVAVCNATADIEGQGLLLSNRYATGGMLGLRSLWPSVVHLLRCPVVPFAEEAQAWFAEACRHLAARLADRAHPYRDEVLAASVSLFFFDLCRHVGTGGSDGAESRPRGHFLFVHFLELVQQHYTTERDVLWYSHQLGVTPKYLAESVRQVSGRTARQWIKMFLLVEIKSQLRNTNRSVKEIAAALNFPNQSFLGKYFKKATGLSPSEYRCG